MLWCFKKKKKWKMEKHRRAKLQAEKAKEIVHKKPSKAPKAKTPEVEGAVSDASPFKKKRKLNLPTKTNVSVSKKYI